MSSRFHNKWHRHNHHTTPVSNIRYPDASHDPIASPESPFLGNFILNGTLSADNIAIKQGTVGAAPGGAAVGSLTVRINGTNYKLALYS